MATVEAYDGRRPHPHRPPCYLKDTPVLQWRWMLGGDRWCNTAVIPRDAGLLGLCWLLSSASLSLCPLEWRTWRSGLNSNSRPLNVPFLRWIEERRQEMRNHFQHRPQTVVVLGSGFKPACDGLFFGRKIELLHYPEAASLFWTNHKETKKLFKILCMKCIKLHF